ncbi:calcium-dependent protein kinase 31 [Plakobranchus ocellatus]|uniref:Calcium-dependent protein kinase 31 n=1 Tax=Plakobranchus ocellatus TaxID=259542 RepID=A0AAV3YVA9_9GAST|nr:calcium-dependent protein kinase 31 [Plakobranchus ocellatus]
MSFFKRFVTRDTGPKISNEARRIYYTAEFEALGDMTKDGLISIEEFMRLMMLLGYPGGRSGCKSIWKYAGKTEGGQMSKDEYISLMFDKKIDSKTNQWRKMFADFDQDGTGWATREEVLQGLEKVGLADTQQIKKLVEDMDGDNDGKVSYTEFLKKQLRQA